MPVVVLVGDSSSAYIEELKTYIASSYTIRVLTDPHPSVRFFLSNQLEKSLYIVPNLSKPERYEIFCLARKNRQQFISLARHGEDLVSSDKNPLILESFDGHRVEAELSKSRVADTFANKRSKGLSLRGIRDIKNMIKQVNEKHYGNEQTFECILRGCEERIIKIWSASPGGPADDFD